MSQKRIKQPNNNPLVMVILDGWGINKAYNGNAITEANVPVFNTLWKNYPHTQLCASGRCVGLPATQDGNSEAGHFNLGAGRIVDQDTLMVSKAIKNGLFFKNPALKASLKHLKRTNGRLHLMGLLTGWQSAHADPEHLLALLTFYRQEGVKEIFLHLFTDGRDSYRFGALDFLKKIRKEMQGGEKIATICGRYYAMDRKKQWDRIEKAYQAVVAGKAVYYAKTAEEAIKQAYDRGESDEFIVPTVIVVDGKCDNKGVCVSGKSVTEVKNGDAVVFFNQRSDRARELTKTFLQADFNKKNPGSFVRSRVLKDLLFVSMTDFGPDLDNILTAFPSQNLKNTLPMVLTDMRQLYIAENEKYAHVTYFFNGGYADPVNGEDRVMVPSLDVSSYDLQPEMSALKITERVVGDIKENKYDFILVNFANPDMVAHTGNLAAGIKACEVVDTCVGKILKVLTEKRGILLVTADHGNIEEMIDEKTGKIDTQHSSFPVPFIIVDKRTKNIKKYQLKDKGLLANVSPTILDLLGKTKPIEMTETSLIVS
ncbi:MAG TPA: 2,3-bisphosphoglycerate-independent phosphoglycerate mutase [bacterium]|nr:2,3-bisphosphoglycerate-independent phosphoglycerate mutase [bacterium]